MTTHVQQTLPFPCQSGRQCSLQLLIQTWIYAPGTHYGWVDRGIAKYEVCPILLHMTNTENRTPDLLILSPTPYPLGHMLPLWYFYLYIYIKNCKTFLEADPKMATSGMLDGRAHLFAVRNACASVMVILNPLCTQNRVKAILWHLCYQ